MLVIYLQEQQKHNFNINLNYKYPIGKFQHDRQSMMSNQKKGYQYYFKKLQGSAEKQTHPKRTDIHTQPYIKYQKYQKYKQNSFVSNSTNKSIKYERSQPYTLQKRGSLYSSGYAPGKVVLNRQPSIGGDTEERNKTKYVVSGNSSGLMNHASYVKSYDSVKQFNSVDDSYHKGEVQQKYHFVTQQKNEQNFINRPSIEQKTDNHSVNFETVDLKHKGRQLTQFFDSTLGHSTTSWNDESLNQQSGKPHHTQFPLNIETTRKQDYFTQIQKFREKLRNEEMKVSGVFTLNGSLAESTEFARIPSEKKLTKCEQCTKMSNKLISSQKQLMSSQEEITQIQRKRQLSMQQVYRQQKYIKELQDKQKEAKQLMDKDTRSKETFYTKDMQIAGYRKRIQVLETLQRQMKQSLEINKQQHKARLEAQLSKVKQESQQLLHRQRQLIGEQMQLLAHERQLLAQEKQTNAMYISCIQQLNQKIEQMDDQNSILMKDLSVRHQKEMEGLAKRYEDVINANVLMQEQSKMLKQQLAVRRQQSEIQWRQVQNMKEQHKRQTLQILNKHSNYIAALNHQHQMTISTVNEQMSDLKTYSEQVPYLTEVIVNLELEVLQAKTVRQEVERESELLKTKVREVQLRYVEVVRRLESLVEAKELLEKEIIQHKQMNKNLTYEKDTLQRQLSSIKNLTTIQNTLSSERPKAKDVENKSTRKQQLQVKTQTSPLQSELRHFKLIGQAYRQKDQKQFERITNVVVQIISLNLNIFDIRELAKRLSEYHQDHINQTPLQQQSHSISPSTSSLSHRLKIKSVQKKPLELQQQQQKQLQQQQKVITELKQRCTESQQKYQLQLQNQIKGTQGIKRRLSQQIKLQLSEQMNVKETQLFSNVKYIEEMDEKLAMTMMTLERTERLCNEKVDQLEKEHAGIKAVLQNQLQITQNVVNGKNGEIAEKQSKITELSQAMILLQQKISTLNNYAVTSSESVNISQQRQVQMLNQQLQSKQFQLNELSYQLQESLEIINLLKQQLEDRNRQDELKKQLKDSRLSRRSYQGEDGHQQSSSDSSSLSNNKQTILDQYFTKIEEYYNEVLEIFGLDIVSRQMLIGENIPEPMVLPKKVEEGQYEAKYMQGENQIVQKQRNEDDLTAFQHEDVQTGSQLKVVQQVQQQQDMINQRTSDPSQPPSSYLTPPASENTLQQAFIYISSNQQQVLRIINQWIRKLQRQSLSIHQYKEKCLFLEQRITQISDQNSILTEEKMEIYDKYETFIAKLEKQNNEIQDKANDMTHKLVEFETYIKEMEEVVHETNKECMKKGIIGLELEKEYNIMGKLIISHAINVQKQHNDTESRKKSYFEEFYQRNGKAVSVEIKNDSANHEQEMIDLKQINSISKKSSEVHSSHTIDQIHHPEGQSSIIKTIQIEPLSILTQVGQSQKITDNSQDVSHPIVSNQHLNINPQQGHLCEILQKESNHQEVNSQINGSVMEALTFI